MIDLLAHINKLEQIKTDRKISPSNVLYLDLLCEVQKEGFTRVEIDNELNRLFKEGKFKLVDSINDRLIVVL